MSNETQIECYFKSAELAKLCQGSKDVVINFKAAYPPDAPPKFTITASAFTRGKKTGDPVKSAISGGSAGDSGSIGGCPKPC